MKKTACPRAFTLLELLAVIAISALLAALAFPIFASVKKHAHQTAGLSNMRQVAVAMLSYAGEHGYALPGRESGANGPGMLGRANMDVRMNRIERPASTLLLGTPKTGSIPFFMDFLEPPHGNNNDILNLHAYENGSNYVFADGSARFIKEADYRDTLWLVDKSYVIPTL